MDKEDKKFIIGMSAIVVSILSIAAMFCMAISAIVYFGSQKPRCEQYARLEGSEISTQFFGSSCLVKYNGQWVDYNVAVSYKQEIKVKHE